MYHNTCHNNCHSNDPSSDLCAVCRQETDVALIAKARNHKGSGTEEFPIELMDTDSEDEEVSDITPANPPRWVPPRPSTPLPLPEFHTTWEQHSIEGSPSQWNPFKFKLTLGPAETRKEKLEDVMNITITDKSSCLNLLENVNNWLQDPDNWIEGFEVGDIPWHPNFKIKELVAEDDIDSIVENALVCGRSPISNRPCRPNGSISIKPSDTDNEDNEVENGLAIGMTKALLICKHALTGINEWKANPNQISRQVIDMSVLDIIDSLPSL